MSIPIDQYHEQNNAIIKGDGGIIGLTQDPTAFRKWAVKAPEQARLIREFQSTFINPTEKTDGDHHRQTAADQNRFHKDVKSLLAVFKDHGNPFKETCPELIEIHTRKCAPQLAVENLRSMAQVGKNQYQQYVKNTLQERTISINKTIHKNSLTIFKTKASIKIKSNRKEVILKSDYSLFSRLYIANQSRQGDMEDLFSHENHPWPPSLSDNGKLRLPQSKSDLLNNFKTCMVSANAIYDAIVVDAPAIVHSLPSDGIRNFEDYFQVFFKWMCQKLVSTNRLDIVWDRYITESLKESTREKRGTGVRTKVSGQAKFPGKFKDFLLLSNNKKELFDFLTQRISKQSYPDDKIVTVTNEKSVLCINLSPGMTNSDHEEADTRLCLHLENSLQHGATKVYVRTVDTDVMVILVSIFFKLRESFPSFELIVGFGMGKHFKHYSVNEICTSLGLEKCEALLFFHAFSGSDTTSQFFKLGKTTMWNAWKSFPDVTIAFSMSFYGPFEDITVNSPNFKLIERFTCVAYGNNDLHSVNELRHEKFTSKVPLMENLPPTQEAFLQHIKRSHYQASIWAKCLATVQDAPSPDGFGWKMDNTQWIPHWSDLLEASKVCKELLRCGCKAGPKCKTANRCKCRSEGLPCTKLCDCKSVCENDK